MSIMDEFRDAEMEYEETVNVEQKKQYANALLRIVCGATAPMALHNVADMLFATSEQTDAAVKEVFLRDLIRAFKNHKWFEVDSRNYTYKEFGDSFLFLGNRTVAKLASSGEITFRSDCPNDVMKAVL